MSIDHTTSRRRKEKRSRKKERTGICHRFRIRGRSHRGVVSAVTRAAMRELQREKLKILLAKGKMPKEIHDALISEYGDAALTYKAVEYHRRMHLKIMRGEPKKRRGRPPRAEVDGKITDVMSRGERVSARKTAKLIKVPRSTTLDHLHALGATYSRVGLVPFALRQCHKSDRMTQADKLLEILRNKNNWPFIVTGDETWLYLNNVGRFEWLLPGETPKHAAKRHISDKKLMLTVFFSSSGVHFVEFLPEGEVFDAHYMCKVISSLTQCIPSRAKGQVWIHMDNARPHRAKIAQKALYDSGFLSAPHPPYSPDLSPCDFYLFGYLKGKLEAHVFSTLEEMKGAVIKELEVLGPKNLRPVYNDWISRLEACKESNGEYFDLDK